MIFLVDLQKHIEDFSGYKLANSHFLLGSKIHIKDFYFAKRMFQNSFFASKFAFVIARYIVELTEMNKDIQKEKLTLIGYGLYSELLLSLVEKFLKKTELYNDENLNHNIINDRERLELIKGYEPDPKNVILIIPIVSTFSTSVKIEEELKKKYSGINIISPHISVLLVSDGELTNEKTNLEEKYGWESIDIQNRIIRVKDFSETKEDKFSIKEQKYLLALNSKWFDIIDCEMCFPEGDFLEEKLLNVTDKTSVTPEFVYDYPQGRFISEDDLKRKSYIEPKMLECGHLVREGTHYHYYIYIEKFFNKNRNNVEKWLRNEVKKKINYKDSDYALIVAPGHFSNAGFVNVANEILFSNSANILHYDPRKDHIQNFQLFYKKEIEKADRIFFVDDTITTGSTFTKANYFIKRTQEELQYKKDIGFDACIILLDRSDSLTNKNILRKLYKKEDEQEGYRHFAFANIHLPSLSAQRSRDGECPICKEKERYYILFEDSFLDRLKVYFLLKSYKLSERSITNSNIINDSTLQDLFIKYNDENRYLKRIEAIHRLYQWFYHKENIIDNFNSFGKWIEDLSKENMTPFNQQLLELKNEESIAGDNATILKVLTQQVFSNYQPLRKKLFSWVLELLNEQIDNVIKDIKQNKLTYNSFRDLKFLLRRAGLLNANYLIREKSFALLKELFDKNGLDSIWEKEKNNLEKEIENIKKEIADNKKNENDLKLPFDMKQIEELNNKLKELGIVKKHIEKNIKDFIVYYTALIKELLFLNEARSMKLEKTIIEFENQSGNSNSFKQFLRIVREENSVLIKQFWEFIKNNQNVPLSDPLKENDNEQIRKILNHNSIKHHYKFQTLTNYFFASNQLTDKNHTPVENSRFLNYLWLMNFFNKEMTEEDEEKTLSQKTNHIINKLKLIIGDEPSQDIGAFFIIEYNPTLSNPYLAYNKGNSSSSIDHQWNNDENKYLINFLNGDKDNSDQEQSNKTIIEFHRKNNEWFNLYENEIERKLSVEFITKEYNRLLLIRINKKYYDKDQNKINDTPQGIIGFYFRQENETITDVNRTRYLLLLRAEISEFIKRHYENNEFWELREANIRKRLTLLTGHGRGMLLEIASKKGGVYESIVNNMLHIQQFILNYEDEKIRKGLQDAVVVPEIFKDYYFTDKVNPQEYNLKKSIAQIAFGVFDFNEIENSVADIDLFVNDSKIKNIDDIQNDFETTFPKELIELFCFEILFNAKKNRWHFNILSVPNFEKNRINICFKNNNENELEIRFTNTGPYIQKDIIDKLNNPTIINIKNDGNDTAGIALIKTILDRFRLGKPNFGSELINENLGFGTFSVTLKLNTYKNSTS